VALRGQTAALDPRVWEHVVKGHAALYVPEKKTPHLEDLQYKGPALDTSRSTGLSPPRRYRDHQRAECVLNDGK
jgi:hypothetical protein